ncbi:YqcC family protein [Teredinibacter turnerae]|uniref:YqcC family protein n=1 Tax=Teredinibacter turnerae TaxID=2426 RepID=UPI00035F23B6|nr:YqcC family protein [Teredinibacter turnerae]
MTDKNTQIASLLMDIEYELRTLGVWSSTPPTPEQLASTQPFCIDTMTFVEWTQFVFIPKMLFIVKNGAPLPEKCGVAPMAEEYFRGQQRDITGLLSTMNKLDEVLSAT